MFSKILTCITTPFCILLTPLSTNSRNLKYSETVLHCQLLTFICFGIMCYGYFTVSGGPVYQSFTLYSLYSLPSVLLLSPFLIPALHPLPISLCSLTPIKNISFCFWYSVVQRHPILLLQIFNANIYSKKFLSQKPNLKTI